MSIISNVGEKLIVDPENTWEVASVIHRGSGDIGVLCGSGEYIDKWARYKPVILSNVVDTTDQLIKTAGADYNKWKSDATWWKADNGLCGFTLSVYHDGSTLVSEWNNNWVYNPPTGGTAAPFRLLDFHYYEHIPGYKPVSISNGGMYNERTCRYEYYINGGGDLVVNFSFMDSIYGYHLKMTDVLDSPTISGYFLDGMFCGILVTYGSDSYAQSNKVWNTNPNKLDTCISPSSAGSGAWNRTVTIPASQLPSVLTGNIPMRIYPYISSNGNYHSATVSTTNPTWNNGVIPCPISLDNMLVYTAQITVVGDFTLPVSDACVYGPAGNSLQVKFDYVITNMTAVNYNYPGSVGGSGRICFFVLDNDIDTTDENPSDDGKRMGRNILNMNGTPVYATIAGFSAAANASTTLSYTTLFNISGSNPLTVGMDAASYVAEYRRRHGSTATPLVTLYMELEYTNDGQAIQMNVPITGIV